MHNIVTVAVVQSVGDGAHHLADLRFGPATVDVLGVVELAAFHELHHDVEIVGVVVDFVHLDDVGVLQLDRRIGTASMISHSLR